MCYDNVNIQLSKEEIKSAEDKMNSYTNYIDMYNDIRSGKITLKDFVFYLAVMTYDED